MNINQVPMWMIDGGARRLAKAARKDFDRLPDEDKTELRLLTLVALAGAFELDKDSTQMVCRGGNSVDKFPDGSGEVLIFKW